MSRPYVGGQSGRAQGYGPYRWFALFVVAALMLQPSVAIAHDAVPHGSDVFDLVKFDQRLDNQLPMELTFRDEKGQSVELSHYFAGKPVILALSYFECETLCPLVRQALVTALQPLAFTVGDEFDVLLVSIDPEETVATAQRVKQETVAEYGRDGSADGWHFLIGDHAAIDQLADAIGFRYAYDGEQDEYAHPAGVVLVTPEGHIARYFFGIEYAPKDLRFGLMEASKNQIGTLVDQLLLMCYHYDPSVGKYSPMIMNIVRWASLVTVSLIGLLIFTSRRKEVERPTALG